MARTLFFTLFYFLFVSKLYGQYTDASFLCPWPCKLKKQIKKKPLKTLEGITQTPNGEDLLIFAAVSNPENTHKYWGGLYFLQLEVCSKGTKNVSCFPDTPEGCTTQQVQLVTSKLTGFIENGACIIVTGAFDDLGIFVCRKIFVKSTNAYVVDF